MTSVAVELDSLMMTEMLKAIALTVREVLMVENYYYFPVNLDLVLFLTTSHELVHHLFEMVAVTMVVIVTATYLVGILSHEVVDNVRNLL